MKILLTTLNARFTHSALALRYLKSYCCKEFPEIDIQEFTINDTLERIIAEIYKNKPDIVGFACYIWNIDSVVAICGELKKVMPGVKIVLGGPEVSFEIDSFFTANSPFDFIIMGEGERTFLRLLRCLAMGNKLLQEIDGIAYLESGKLVIREAVSRITNLDEIPSPFEISSLEDLKDKVVYYETSRGCPFNCQYCLSSTEAGVRYFSLARVKSDLQILIDAQVKKVKFVDRTFNCDPERALEIWDYLVQNRQKTAFHFEIAADILDEKTLAFLAKVPQGLFQFEIGVQSTNVETLKIIKRRMDFFRLKEKVEKIQQVDNIHLHLDLIAGLPGENYESFKKSFNDVYALKPDKIQLGFLKLLKGSGLRNNYRIYNYQYTSYPPYEVLSNNVLTFQKILDLKMIEEMVERYSNSHRFKGIISYLLKWHFSDPFSFFESLARYWEENGLHLSQHANKEHYDILANFISDTLQGDMFIFKEILKFDLLLQEKTVNLPSWCISIQEAESREKTRSILDVEGNLQRVLKGKPFNGDFKQLTRNMRLEVFGCDVFRVMKRKDDFKGRPTYVLFYYSQGQRCQVYKVDAESLDIIEEL